MFIWNRWRHLVLRLECLEQRVRVLEEGVIDLAKAANPLLKLDENGRVTAVDASHIQGLEPHPFIRFVPAKQGASFSVEMEERDD